MFLSFIVPVYNTEKYVAECLDSLLDQDIPKDDYEIICINDGSTDGSSQILNKYRNIYQNIIVIDQLNSGVATARNTGLDAARGEYIWFVDSDDMIISNILYELKLILQTNHFQRLRIGSYVFDEILTEDEKINLNNRLLTVNSNYYDSVVWNSIINRNFLETNNCRFHYPDITHGEDTIFMYELLLSSPINGEYNTPVYLYRFRPASAMSSCDKKNMQKKLHSAVCAMFVMHDHLQSTVIMTERKANMYMNYLWTVMYYSIIVGGAEGRKARITMKQKGFFPTERIKECSLTRSYQTTRKDIVGRIFDQLYINLHRPWGVIGMWILQQLIKCKHSICK